MNIISIDPSKYSIGLFYKVDGEEFSDLIQSKRSETNEQIFCKVYNRISLLLSCNKFHFGLIEGYGFNPKNKSGMTTLAEICGIIKLVFARNEIPLIVIPVQVWKKYTIGKVDKKKKDKYLELINNKYDKDFETTDEADAYLFYVTAKIICKTITIMSDAATYIKRSLQAIIKTMGVA